MAGAPDSLGQGWEMKSVLQNRFGQALPLLAVFLIGTFFVYINADSPFITMSQPRRYFISKMTSYFLTLI